MCWRILTSCKLSRARAIIIRVAFRNKMRLQLTYHAGCPKTLHPPPHTQTRKYPRTRDLSFVLTMKVLHLCISAAKIPPNIERRRRTLHANGRWERTKIDNPPTQPLLSLDDPQRITIERAERRRRTLEAVCERLSLRELRVRLRKRGPREQLAMDLDVAVSRVHQQNDIAKLNRHVLFLSLGPLA